MNQLPFDWKPAERPSERPAMTVTDLARRIAAALEQGVPDPVRVQGEVAAFSERRGHWYFTLRDDEASIQCVMWASDVRRGARAIAMGDVVRADGTVVHWAPQGRTQVRVRSVSPVGAGDRLAAFRRLCEELRGMGWFDESARAPLPEVPRRVALLTSAAGAAVHDVRAEARRRWPACRIDLIDVPVQGEGAAARMAEVIGRVDAEAGTLGIDALILTRGGGSAEDLQAFNERVLAEAVHAASVPIVAAIGHESDTTIAELVADRRASTPTQAVMVLLPDREEEAQRLTLLRESLDRRLRALVSAFRERSSRADAALQAARRLRLAAASQRLARGEAAMLSRRPHATLAAHRAIASQCAARLEQCMLKRVTAGRAALASLPLDRVARHRIEQSEARLRQRVRVLEAVGPESVLARGFSLTRTAAGAVVRDASDVRPGEELDTRVASGTIRSIVAGESQQGDLPSPHA
ncbi:MAG: exodeoxyribonuclease VII large subunit [Phycisphaerales bacterium]|nr:exodeoxyribonuclease VII large subunit [Phycisphaerales bacterium]